MAEKIQSKSNHSKLRDDNDAKAGSKGKDSRTTRTGRGRTHELAERYERNLSHASGGGEETRRQRTNPVQIIPSSTLITVSSPDSGIAQPLASSSSSSSSDRDKRHAAQSKISVRSGSDRARQHASKAGETGEGTFGARVTSPPPLSPPPDDTTVRNKPRYGGANYNILPSQTNPSGATGTSATKGSTPLTTAGTTDMSVTKGLTTKSGATGLSSSSKSGQLRVSMPRPSSPHNIGYQSLPSPTTSSGTFSSGELPSSGGLLSGEHTIAQANSLDGSARVVGGTTYGRGHSSFGINPHNYTPTKDQREPSSDLTTTAATDSPQNSISTTATSHLSQASVRVRNDGDDTLLAEGEGCRDKLLLATNSLGMSETGRPILNTSMSEGTVVGIQHQFQFQALHIKINELELRNAELQRQLNVQQDQTRDERPRDGGSLEEAYTRRDYVDHLVSEVKRLELFEKEVEALKRQLKRMEELHIEAQKRDKQLCGQVALVSLKETEITELKRQLSAAKDNQLASGSKSGTAEIARLTEQLTGKEHEIARVRARLKKYERAKSVEATEEDSIGDIAAMQADYEKKLEHKENMITRLKKRVTELAEATQQPVPGECESAMAKHESSAESSIAALGGVVDEHYLESNEDGDTGEVGRLQRAVKERDRKIKKLSDQLQTFIQTATDMGKIVQHSKGQSGEIARLKKQLEVAEAEREVLDSQQEAKVVQSSSEIEKKLTESLSTVRRLHLQTKKLEEENRTLKDSAHEYANTKLAEVEREYASLQAKAREQQEVIATMGAKLEVLSQQKAACEEQNRSLAEGNKKLKAFSNHLEQKVIGQQASIQNLVQDLQVTKERASETAVTMERYKLQNHELQKQCQDLQGEKEAIRAMAEVYQEDFNNERKDRESAHAQKNELEERYANNVAKLKEQLQRVSADNGRLSKTMREKEGQLQRQIQEMKQHIEALNADKNALQGEIQSKTQQVKQYKKQVDQFRGELDRCHADIEAYKQQAEHLKQQIEGVANQYEQLTQTARALQDENSRLKIDFNTLESREHLRQHAAQQSQGQQGGREGAPITVEEFIKERKKHEDMVRMLREMEHKLEEVTLQKVLVDSENEELKKVLSSGPSSSSRSPPPVSIAAGAPTGRPPPYSPSHRGHGGSALPNPVRPQYQYQSQNRRMNQQMKSASVDSADMLSSRGHIDAAQFQPPIPSISVAGSNPPPPTTRPEAAYRTDQRYQQPPHAHHKSHTSALPSPQRDLAVSQPFQAALSNSTAGTNAQAAAARGAGGRGGYPYSSAISHGGNVVTNAGMGGGNSQYPAMNSPPTNAKFNAPFPTSSAGGPTLMPGPPSSSSGGSNYPHTSPHHVSASVGNMQQPPPLQPHGSQLAPGLSQAGGTFPSNVPLASNVAQSSAGSRVAPPFSSHGPSVPARTAVGSQDAAQRQFYHNLPFDHQVHDQYHMSPPPDDGQGSGHMSLPSFGSGGFQQQQQVGQPQVPVHGHPQANHNHHHTPKDDLYLIQQQKGGHGYHHHHHHPGEGSSGQPRAYPSAIDVVEKDSSPPSSFVPQQGPSQQGPPLSLNPQSLSQQPTPQHRQRYSHRVPLSPEHSKNDNNMGIPGGAKQQPRRVMPDGLRPTVGGGHGMMMQGGRNDPVQLPPHHVQSVQVLAYQHQQQQQRRTVGGAMVNQGQRPASHAVKGSIQESGTGLTKLPPSMQKTSGSGAVYVTSQENRNQEQHRPEPDSDSVSNVSMESGLNSPTGDGRANANENTLEKGIDGDIRRAARNIKKQMGGKESSVGGGVEAPYDPNLTCPSCGFRFRIGEIQKFKRHASTCTGT